MAPPTRLQSPQSPAMPGSAVPRRPITIAPLDREWHAPPFVPPSARADYRLGRALARVVCWAGGVAAILGLALVPVSILAPDLLAAAPVAVRLAGAATFGFGAAAGGLLLVLLGQLVRALLDQANATRDMAAMVRARADHEAATGTPTRSVRD